MSEFNNVRRKGNTTFIFNGGNALKDCPTYWDEAQIWAEKANGENDGSTHPLWSFDCGFKLDYDGGILSIMSRFYPPKTHSGKTWDGTVTLYLLGDKIKEKKFDCETLEILKSQVEDYILSIKKILLENINL